MRNLDAAELLCALAGAFLLINFSLFDAPIEVYLSGMLAGTVALTGGGYNALQAHRGKPGTERLNQASILIGLWIIFLVLFWEVTELIESTATVGGVVVTLTSTYAAYRRERTGRTPRSRHLRQ